MVQGWMCPKCGSIYAPFVEECWRCSDSHTPGITYKNDYDSGMAYFPLLYCRGCGEFYKSNEFHGCKGTIKNNPVMGGY